MVHQTRENDSKGPSVSEKLKKASSTAFRPQLDPSIVPKASAYGLRLVSEKLKVSGVSKKASKLIMNSWRSKTRKQYRCYLRRFSGFCSSRNVNPFHADVNLTLDFLSDMYSNGLGYSAINTARAAISTINGTGSHPLICRLLKGVFNLRPSKPRYSYIWDVSMVLNLLRKLSPARELSLLLLGAKLLTLCALVTGHRCQTFQAMDILDMNLSATKAVFHLQQLLKHNSPKNPSTVITLNAYQEDKRICVVTYLRIYLKRTRPLRSSSKLFISSYGPHKGVSRDTLSRWIKMILHKAGVDTSVFKAHSTRAASTSMAAQSLDINHVTRTAGWANESTFAKFYKKPLQITVDSGLQFASSVLSSKPV